MSKKTDNGETSAIDTKWTFPKAEALKPHLEAVKAAEAGIRKAEAALDKARAETSKAVVAMLEALGRPPASDDDEYTFPPFVSAMLGGKVQPVIRRTKNARTGFVKRFGDEDIQETI